MLSDFYKEDGKQIWQIDNLEKIGEFLFSFDKKKIYNFWEDYDNLTAEQRALFDEEFPAMAVLKK